MIKKISSISILFVLFTWLLHSQDNTGYEQKPFVLRNITVIDATGSPPKTGMTVVIKGNLIADMGKTEKISVPKNALVVEAKGKFLIPGLWDMHTHWYEINYLPLYIANGVTGVRQMHGFPSAHLHWRREIAKGKLLGPRMEIGSPIIDGPKPVLPYSISVGSEEEARETVRKEKQKGADFIKTYTLLPRDIYLAITDEAKKQGMPIAGHVPVSISAAEASDAGHKSIEHGTGLDMACSSQENEWRKEIREAWAKRDPNRPSNPIFMIFNIQKKYMNTEQESKAAALYARFVKNGTWICPTLPTLRNKAYLNDERITQDPSLKYMPASIKAGWDPENMPLLAKITPEEWAVYRKIFNKTLESVGAMHRAGVRILAGTDTLTAFCFPGFSLHDSLALLVQAGLSPMDALQAATRNAAEYLDRLETLGTIEKGKLADLVILEANPLENITNTRKIAAVVVDGKLFPKASLQEMLVKVEAIAKKKSVSGALLRTMMQKDTQAAIQQYHELKSNQPNDYDFDPWALNFLGWQLLHMKRFDDAIKIFKLNMEAYPQNYIPYDSLGEAYIAKGEKELAVKSYQKSLQLNPKNTNAAAMLKILSKK